MVVTRRQGVEPAAQGADQGATEEAQGPTTSSGSREATERTTTTDGSGPAEETSARSSAEKNGEHSSQRTVRSPKSRHSTSSRKKKELEVKQRLAELKIEQIRAEAEVQRLRLQQLQENSTSEDDSGDDLASVRIGTWLQKGTEAPQTHVSQENIGSTGDDHTKGKPSEKEVVNSDCKVNEKSRESASVKSPVIDVSTLAAALSQAMRSTREPPKYVQELPFFSGSSTEWLAFKTTYEESSIYFTRNENIARIRRSLRGIAKEAVECLLLCQPDPETIIKALERRFGRPEALIHAEMERLKTLRKLTDNARDLCVFAGKIANMVGTVEALKKPHYLHSPEMSRIIIEKLTPIIRNNWYDFSAKKKEDIPELKKISMFLSEEADKCSSYALPEATPREENRGHGYRSQRTRRVEQTLSVNKKTSEDTCPQCKHEHKLFECKQFIALDTNARWEAAKKYNICYRCLQGKHRRITCKAPRCGKNGCTMKHHNLLHHDKPPGEYASTSEVTNDAITTSAAELTIAANPLSSKRKAYLKIAPVTLKGPRGSIDTFALLDEGSTITLIDETVADIIGADGPSKEIWIQGVNSDMKHTSKTVSLLIKGKYAEDEYDVTARTMERLRFTPDTVYEEHLSDCEHLIDIRDKVIYEKASPKVLLGQDNWHLIVTRQLRTGNRDQPVASLTYLGWVLHGYTGATTATVSFCGKLQQHENNTIEDTVKNYFKLESLGIEPRKPRQDPEHQAMQILERTSRRLPDGRFETGLLWKNENVNIPNNYVEAERRLLTLERRLDRDEALKQKYEERMENLFKSGYAEPAPTPPPTGKTWYLPHFPVINPAKPHKPPRLVHDAAAKSKGVCLNDMLHSGPDLLQSLPGVIMRFRQQPYAVSADIKEMFMQVKIRQEDRDALRFLWRGQQRTGQPNEYRMTSVIFGATSSPCTALYIKNRNARDYLETHPDAVKAIQKNHYMDDYLQSFPTVTAARDTTQTVDMVHKKAGFVLDGWTSNEKTILKGLSTPLDNSTTVILGGQETEKTLGLLWHVKEDHLGFNVSNLKISQEVKMRTRPPTKREALSVIMALFDPLGLISPITTPGKRIFQDTWRYKTEWDDPLPEELRERWNKWFTQLNEVEQLRIPRCYIQNKSSVISCQLHTFVDASEEAYAAAVYWRAQHTDGATTVSLAAAKSRVTPLKPVSIPRLELQAALLGARLAQTVLEEHEYEVTNKIYWCDSRTALTWIRSEPRAYKPFVSHRVAEIEESTKKNEWRWLPTRLNVADDATRATPKDFGPTHRWYTGPTFLQLTESEWPIEEKTVRYDTGEERETCHTSASQKIEQHSTSNLLRIEKYSKWTRLIRTTARVLQFIALCRRDKVKAAAARKRTRKIDRQDPDWRNKKSIPIPNKDNKVKQNRQCYLNIPSEYLIRAEQLCINASQRDSFASEIQRITRGETNVRDNRLTYVSVYIDACGTLRIKGRISAATAIGEDMSDPVVLDGKHPYTRLYIKHVHEKLHHGGTEITVNELRQRLWITKIRPAVKNEIKRCVSCRIRKAKPATPTTGNLPAARLAHNTRPFSFTGLDYFGPIEVTVARHREKRYGALFTCMTSRAIHLEVVHSLSADSAVSALRRFIARRGCPKEVWSDNATCFKAAEKELAEAARDALKQEVTSHHIAWRYIPPSAPFMGGAWERMVKAVKEALRVTMIEKHPSDETLLTLLTEVENIVNSRPLTHVSVDPCDPEALTPNHILIGPNCHVPPPGHFSADDVSARQQWKRAQALADIFWRRWVKEYLPLLQHRRESSSSGVSPKVGDVVIICDSNLPRNTWPRGRVSRVYPGADGEVRVVDVITSGGNTLRRPTRKIVVLPTTEFADVTGSATAGECARQPIL